MAKKNRKNGNVLELLKESLGAKFVSELEIDDWIDTGLITLNYLLSGNLDKGVPSGRILTFAGPEQSGKSFLAARIGAEAQKKGYYVVWLDSEGGVDKEYLKRAGLDISKTLYYNVASVEEFQISTNTILKTAKEKNIKFYIVMDSIGNLASVKELNDAEKNEIKSDMGHKAKALRSLLRVLTPKILQTGSILVMINHLYTGSGYIPVEDMSGGKGPWYLSAIVLFLNKKKAKEDDSIILKVKTAKNRFFFPDRYIELTLNYHTGLDETDSLIKILTYYKIIEQNGGWYSYKGKKYRKNDIITNKELFKEIIERLKEEVEKDNFYSFLQEEDE